MVAANTAAANPTCTDCGTGDDLDHWGVAAAIAASRVLESVLSGVPRHDALSDTGEVAVFVARGALAAFVPAGQAARIEPVRALREG
ncbi:MAG TPA: hypothetical protein VMM79_19500 [Longimicrobiales bacterium]|nr:hypothetical protein [Longimicrobiales bacterium]